MFSFIKYDWFIMCWLFFNFIFRECVYDGLIINIICLKCYMFYQINFKIKIFELLIVKKILKNVVNLCVVLILLLNNYFCYLSIEEVCNKWKKLFIGYKYECYKINMDFFNSCKFLYLWLVVSEGFYIQCQCLM